MQAKLFEEKNHYSTPIAEWRFGCGISNDEIHIGLPMSSKDDNKGASNKPRVLILGGLGHIGRTFLQYLVREQAASYIRLTDKAIPITAYCSKDVEACIKLDYVEFMQADLTKDLHLEKVFQCGPNGEGFDYIVNAAAETRNGLSEDIYNNRILELSVKCAQWALKMDEKVKTNKLVKWIELSSCQVYASQTRRPAKEDAAKKPWTVHAKYKLMAEEALQKISEGDRKLPLIILRVANVYGPGDVRGVMPRIVTAAAYQVLGEPMNFLWGADLKINTIHIEDVVNGIWHSCKNVQPNTTWNLCDSGNTTQGIMSAVLGELFDIKTGFYGVLISNFARLNLSSIVDEANDKHMKPWNELCARCGIRATPLDPYMDKELLSSNHLYIDGSAITNSTGFKYKHARLTKDLVKASVIHAIEQKLFPNILAGEDRKMPAKEEGTGGVVEGKS